MENLFLFSCLASIEFLSSTMSRPRGSIPRPVVPGFEHARATSLAVRSRSISPSSTITLQSTELDPIEKSSPLTTKNETNGIRDRYRTHKRLHFFTRQNHPLKCVSTPPLPAAAAFQPADVSIRDDSAYASLITPSTHTQRQRAISLLSSSSALSDVFNQDAIFDDEFCSLKSVDLLCDQDETLTLDSTSRKSIKRNFTRFVCSLCLIILVIKRVHVHRIHYRLNLVQRINDQSKKRLMN